MTRLLALPAALGLLAALACGGGGAPPDPVAAVADAGSRCAPGGLQRVDYWQGEYPDPVVHVQAAIEVPAYTDPCLAAPDTTCAVDPAVYHPWGVGDGFVTLRAVQTYTASAAFTVEGHAVEAGETIEIPAYLAEGYCRWRVRGEPFEAACPGVEDYPLAEASTVAPPEVQLMQPGCGAWVEVDEAFMAREGVAPGTVLGWGEVGPAE